MKKIFACFTVLILLLCLCIPVSATDTINQTSLNSISVETKKEKIDSPTIISSTGSVSIKNSVIIGGEKYDLYCTFDNPQMALESVANSANNVINLLQSTYDLDSFSESTWEKYYDSMYDLFDDDNCPSWYNESNAEFKQLRSFFDIYENTSKNKDIIFTINNLKSPNSSDSKSSISTNIPEILDLLPYTSLTKSNNSNKLSTTVIGFNVDKGIAYAEKWAKSKNTDDYYYFSRGDCTNFTSQILENGGVAQEVYSDVTKGWWHTKTSHWYRTTHKHSNSWTMADVFARYMGIGYTTTNNTDFSKNIQAGDFIGLDHDSDGDWDHMGFVTERHSYKTNGYYDYRVAQHTSNYLEWASSDKNGWDTAGNDGGTYARVRR